MATNHLINELHRAIGTSAARELLGIIEAINARGNTYYVDSVVGSDTFDGLDWDHPLATLSAAVAKCAANRGDVIFLSPGHNEGIGDAQLDLNVAGISIIGLGRGSSRPRFDFDHANASIDISASGILLKNVTLLPSVATVAIGIDVEAAVTDTLLEDLEVLPGEDGAGADEFVLAIDVKAGCTRTTVRRLKYRQYASADGTNAGISLTGASDDVRIEDCDIELLGTAAVAPIKGITTLSTKVRIERCTLVTDAEPGIELLTGTTGVISECRVFTDLATIDASIVADACAHFDNKYVEVGNEAGTLVKTESVDD